MLTAILVLCVVGGGALAWQATRRERTRSSRLPVRVRGPGELRTRDVVSYLGRDYLVEGVVTLGEGALRRRLARLCDGPDECWLLAEGDELVLLRRASVEAPPLPPPESLLLETETYHLVDSGAGRAVHHGDVGTRTHDRARFWRYRGPGGRRAWLDDFRTTELLVGEVVSAAMLEVLPGS